MKKRIFLIALFGVLVALFLLRRPLLTAIAEFLIVPDRPRKADVIIVLSGDASGGRVVKGVELFKKGYAKKIIMSGGKLQWNTYEPEIMKNHAIHLGMAEGNIVIITQGGSTNNQATKLTLFMQEHGLRSALLVTSDFHSRRARYIFKKKFLKEGLDLQICTSHSKEFNPSEWWTNTNSAETVFYEYTKLIWYLLRY